MLSARRSGGLHTRRPRHYSVPVPPAPVSATRLVVSPMWSVIPQGESVDFVVRALRQNNDDPIELTVPTLPAGTTASFPDGSTLTTVDTAKRIRITAAPDAPAVYGEEWVVSSTGSAGVSDFTAHMSVPPAGPYAYLAPLAKLPRDVHEQSMQYDSTTGLCTGTAWDTSWITWSWLVANAQTVVRIKAVGGDYGPLQLQAAINDAAARNDLTVIVIDSQLVCMRTNPTSTAGMRFRSKAPTYEQSEWTFIVSADWWDGIWAPSGPRYLDIRPTGLNERQYLAVLETGLNTSGEGSVFYCDPQSHKYALIGMWLRRSPSQDFVSGKGALINSESGADSSDGRVYHWCEFDGGQSQRADGKLKGMYGGFWHQSRFLSCQHSLMHGFGHTGDEFKGIISTSSRHCKLMYSAVEATSINILLGGGNPGDAKRLPEDWEIRFVYLFKDQFRNSGSANFVKRMPGYVPTGFGAVQLNKQGLEIKYGKRILIEAVVVENSYPGNDQIGTGISVQTQGQAGYSNIQTWDVNIRHVKALRCVNPINWNIGGNYQDSLNPDPIKRWDLCNILAHKLSAAERDPNQRDEDIPDRGFFNMTANSSTYYQAGTWYGPLTVRWLTSVAPVTLPGESAGAEGTYRMRAGQGSTASLALYVAQFTDSIWSNRWRDLGSTKAGITSLSTTPTGPQVFKYIEAWKDALEFTRIALPTNVSYAQRAMFNGLFQAQHDNAALWPGPMGDQVYEFVKNDEVNPWLNNYRLAPTSPLKGQGAGGRDLGANIDLLDAVTAGVKNWHPDEAQLTFPLAGGGTWPIMRVDFVPAPPE